jgi:hypothetical protein
MKDKKKQVGNKEEQRERKDYHDGIGWEDCPDYDDEMEVSSSPDSGVLMELIGITSSFTTLVKGRGHKYIKREIKDPGPPKKYRYWYKNPRAGIVTDSALHVGAKFRFGEGNKKGHYTITAVDGNQVTIQHDELDSDHTHHTRTLTIDELKNIIHTGQHELGEDRSRGWDRRKKAFIAAWKHGTDRQVEAREKDFLDYARGYWGRTGNTENQIEQIKRTTSRRGQPVTTPSPFPTNRPTTPGRSTRDDRTLEGTPPRDLGIGQTVNVAYSTRYMDTAKVRELQQQVDDWVAEYESSLPEETAKHQKLVRQDTPANDINPREQARGDWSQYLPTEHTKHAWRVARVGYRGRSATLKQYLMAGAAAASLGLPPPKISDFKKAARELKDATPKTKDEALAYLQDRNFRLAGRAPGKDSLINLARSMEIMKRCGANAQLPKPDSDVPMYNPDAKIALEFKRSIGRSGTIQGQYQALGNKIEIKLTGKAFVHEMWHALDWNIGPSQGSPNAFPGYTTRTNLEGPQNYHRFYAGPVDKDTEDLYSFVRLMLRTPAGQRFANSGGQTSRGQPYGYYLTIPTEMMSRWGEQLSAWYNKEALAKGDVSEESTATYGWDHYMGKPTSYYKYDEFQALLKIWEKLPIAKKLKKQFSKSFFHGFRTLIKSTEEATRRFSFADPKYLRPLY